MLEAIIARNPTEKLYVEDVFNTYLYKGTGAAQTITNGIDLAGKGGMVWIKDRSATVIHSLYDTARGVLKSIYSNSTYFQENIAESLTNFNSNGFSIGSVNIINGTGDNLVSWTFRKAPKFFDIVTYTGDGSSSRSISHNLGSTPGMYVVKRTDIGGSWAVWHRSLGDDNYLVLEGSQQSYPSTILVRSANATTFTVGSDATVNASGGTYVAYLFAHNAGGFGADGSQNVISCGSFTGSATVNLGWEPQYILFKRTDGTQDWYVMDNMRGIGASGSYSPLNPNLSAAEATYTNGPTINATGFTWMPGATASYIYLAIRRGPMRVPTDATKVFNSVARTGTGATAQITSLSFPPDTVLIQRRNGAGDSGLYDKLRGSNIVLYPQYTLAEQSVVNYVNSFDQNGITLGNDTPNISGHTFINWFFRRASGFFDVVGYTGTGVARSISHNLGVTPEFMIVKMRSQTGPHWNCWTSAIPTNKRILLNTTDGLLDSTTGWNNTAPTSTNFSVGTFNETNNSGDTFIAYLFASCPGVSKVGSYTGNGSSLNIDCGFTNGARFVLIKRTDSTGDWYVWDTVRGIVAANDPHLSLNNGVAEVTTDDSIDPLSTGFTVNQLAATNINVNAATYIYLAIA